MDPNVALTRLRDAARFGQGGISIDTFTDLDEWLTRGGFLPAPWSGRTVAWVSDDTEECQFCTWPEHSTVVLRIGHTTHVCEDHVMRGLRAVLGPHPRYAGVADAAEHCAECGATLGSELVGDEHAEACSLHPSNVTVA